MLLSFFDYLIIGVAFCIPTAGYVLAFLSIVFHRLLGAWDYEVGVEVPELAMVTSVADDFMNDFGDGISSLSIHPILHEHFTGSYPYAQ